MGKNADAIAEGLAITEASCRLAVKNHILVETIAHDEDFDPDRFAPFARDALVALAVEAETAARLAKRQRKAAWGQFSQPDGTHDYRDRDTRNLRRRRTQYLGVAKGLRALAADSGELHRIVEDARELAWSEVEGNLERRLNVEGMRPDVDPDYGRMREARMQSLRLVDLQRLASQHRARTQAARAAAGEVEAADGACDGVASEVDDERAAEPAEGAGDASPESPHPEKSVPFADDEARGSR